MRRNSPNEATEAELDGDDTELKRLVDADLASLNAPAKRLDLPVTLVVR
jgi:hypothetical protein